MTVRQASILMIISGVLWGTNPALVKLADWTPLGTAWLRGLFCTVLICIYLIWQKSFSFKSPLLQIASGLFLALNSTLFVSASLYTSPANTVLLMFSFPWITMALDYFILSRKPSSSDLVRLLMGVIGVAVIAGGGLDGSGSLGDLFALLAGLAIAAHIFISQRIGEKHGGNREVLTAVMVGWIMSALVLAPFAYQQPPQQGESQLFYLFLFGLLSAIPWLFWGKAIAFISGHVAAALLGVEVFVAAMCGWLILGEIPVSATWLGGAFVLVAASWQILSASQTTDS